METTVSLSSISAAISAQIVLLDEFIGSENPDPDDLAWAEDIRADLVGFISLLEAKCRGNASFNSTLIQAAE